MQSIQQEEDKLLTMKCLLSILFALLCLLAAVNVHAEIKSLGPDGGDVRRIAYDPHNLKKIFLGTSSGQMYLSEDEGRTWAHFAHFGDGLDYVLDSIVFDPTDSRVVYVAAWSIERNYGELFKSSNGGKSWKSMGGMKGKSIRSFALAPSEPRELVVGALDGIFISKDAGENWSRITPANHPHLKDVQSLAVDPTNPETIYAGTWHLAWKTTDGGKNWKQIKNGMIDDSDVFSIIVDPKDARVIYASACSGIYKSENGGELFHKVQGIPFSSRRTRVLKQNPDHSEVVYAGTTEGLWRTLDSGKNWERISTSTLIINDVLVTPHNSDRIMLATDRSGILVSGKQSHSFDESNTGFTHRQVRTILPSVSNPGLVYAGMINDKEFGGVFSSADGGAHWNQHSAGLSGHDVFALAQDSRGHLLAGTDGGLFRLESSGQSWQHMDVRGAGRFRVEAVAVAGNTWFAASESGLFFTHDQGRNWAVRHSIHRQPFIAVQARRDTVVGATYNSVTLSKDAGAHWAELSQPPVSVIKSVAIDENSRIWIASREGLFRQDGETRVWRHVQGDWSGAVNYVASDRDTGEMLVVAGNSKEVYSSKDGQSWKALNAGGLGILRVTAASDKLFAATSFDGLVALDGGEKRSFRASITKKNK